MSCIIHGVALGAHIRAHHALWARVFGRRDAMVGTRERFLRRCIRGLPSLIGHLVARPLEVQNHELALSGRCFGDADLARHDA